MWAQDGADVENRNEAYALASCEDCTTVAIAFQVVVVVGQSDVVIPKNLSAAVNYNCVSCVTAALAQQLVVGVKRLPTEEAMGRLNALWAELMEFNGHITEKSLTEIMDTLDRFEVQFLKVLKDDGVLSVRGRGHPQRVTQPVGGLFAVPVQQSHEGALGITHRDRHGWRRPLGNADQGQPRLRSEAQEDRQPDPASVLCSRIADDTQEDRGRIAEQRGLQQLISARPCPRIGVAPAPASLTGAGWGRRDGAVVCFSVEADLVAGAALLPVGVLALREVRQHNEVPFAVLPLLFAAHQLVEAVVWWGVDGGVSTGVRHAATLGYVIYALVVLPTLVPLAVLFLEPRRARLRVAIFVVIGLVVSVALLVGVLSEPVRVVAHSHALEYQTGVTHGGLWAVLYVIAVIGPALLSGYRSIVAFGLLNLVGLVVVALVYKQAFASLWCVYAAVVSVLVVVHMVLRRRLPDDHRLGACAWPLARA